MKINEVEALVGITKKNIRFYEAEGLLTPRRNSENGYRDYGDEDVAVLRRIKLMRKLGLPLEDIRQMLSGAHTVGDGMRRHLVTLERERQNLDAAAKLCGELADCQERLDALDVDALLEEMAEMEQSGTTFQNKQSQDIRVRYVAPVVVTVLMVLLMLGLIWLFLWAFETDPAGAPPLPILAVFVACFRQDIARFAVQSEQLGTIPVTYSGFTRFHGCSVRLHYTLGLALTKSPYDTHFALPVRLPLYHRLTNLS